MVFIQKNWGKRGANPNARAGSRSWWEANRKRERKDTFFCQHCGGEQPEQDRISVFSQLLGESIDYCPDCHDEL